MAQPGPGHNSGTDNSDGSKATDDRLRKMKPDERAEQETILDTYKVALGMG